MTRTEVTLRCLQCRAPLAVDQRYCIECGERTGPLPQQVLTSLAAIATAHRDRKPS